MYCTNRIYTPSFIKRNCSKKLFAWLARRLTRDARRGSLWGRISGLSQQQSRDAPLILDARSHAVMLLEANQSNATRVADTAAAAGDIAPPCPCGASREDLVAEDGVLICTTCGRVLDRTALAPQDPGRDTRRPFHESLDSSRLAASENWTRVERRVREMGAEHGLSEPCISMAQKLIRASLAGPRTGQTLESHAACSLLLASRRNHTHTHTALTPSPLLTFTPINPAPR